MSERIGPSDQAPLWQGDISALEVSRSLRRLMALVKSRALLYLVAWTAFLVAGGVVYSATLRPEYTSTIQILLQPRRIINDGPEDRRHYHQFVLDNQQCETELSLVTSQQLLNTVYRSLQLGESPEVRNQFDSITSALRAVLRPVNEANLTLSDDFGFRRFVSRIRARRTGLSYILNITYRAYDPQQAAKVVGSIANAYVASRLRSASLRYRESGPYLQSRVALLQQQLAIANEGIRTGRISDQDFHELDVRILGQPDTTLGPVYPRRTPLMITLAALGLVSGSLVLLFRAGRPGSKHNKAAPIP